MDGISNYMSLTNLEELGNQHNLSVTITFALQSIEQELSSILVRTTSDNWHNGYIMVSPATTELEVWGRNPEKWTTLLKKHIELKQFVTVTVTVDENSIVKTYFNGALESTEVFTNTSFRALDNFIVGANGVYKLYSNMAFASLMIHNKTLTDLEVKQIYNYENKIKRTGVI